MAADQSVNHISQYNSFIIFFLNYEIKTHSNDSPINKRQKGKVRERMRHDERVIIVGCPVK